MSRCSRYFMRKSSDVGTESADKVKWVANMVFSSSLFTPSMNFEAMARFLSEILSSRLLLLLSSSRSSKNLSKISSSLWRLFSKTSAGCQKFSRMSKILRALSRSFNLSAIIQLRAVPFKLLVNALHSCFFERFSSSKYQIAI